MKAMTTLGVAPENFDPKDLEGKKVTWGGRPGYTIGVVVSAWMEGDVIMTVLDLDRVGVLGSILNDRS